MKGIDALIVGNVVIDRGFAGLQYSGMKDYIPSATVRLINLHTGELISAATFSVSRASTMSEVKTPADIGHDLAESLID